MALKMDVDLANGLPVVRSAYLRVEGAKVHSKTAGVRMVVFGLHCYASAEYIGQPLRPAEYHQITYQGGDIEVEAYQHIKALPEYAGAIDA